MFFIFDNLIATMLGIAVLFILVLMQERVQRVSAEQVMMYAANENIIDFGLWVEKDLANVGWGVVGANGITAYQSNDSIPNLTKTFAFDRRLKPSAVIPANVQYQVIPSLNSLGVQNFMTINGTGVPLWQVQRVVTGDVSGEIVDGAVTGESAPYITHFRIALENDFGEEVATVADAVQISVQVAMAMPFGNEAHLSETHWGTTVGLSVTN